MKNSIQNKCRNLIAIFAFLLMSGSTFAAPCNASFTFTVTGQTVTFTNTSTGNNVNPTYYWNFGDNQTQSSTNATHTYQYGGLYFTCLTMMDSLNNCYSYYCDSFTIVGPQAPCHSSFYASSSNNLGSFQSTSTGTTPNTVYNWSFGDNSYGTGQYVNHTYLNSGWYNVCLAITDNSTQCSDSFCQQVYIYGTNNSQCNASYTYSTGMNLGTFTSTSTGTTTNTVYNWSFGDNQYGTGQNISHSYMNTGWYTVCLTISDNSTQCYDSICQQVYIPGTNNSTCSANFTHATNAQTVTFTDASTGTNVNTNYYWDLGDGNYDYTQNPVHTYTYGGTYNVCLTIWDSVNTCLSNYCDTVTVSGPNMPCNASFLAFPDTFNTHNTWIFNLSTGTNPMQYTWNWGDNTPDDYTQYPSHTYATSGVYNICLTIVDANLCTSTWCDQVNVQRLSAEWVAAPSTINVINPAGINDVHVSHEISIYPNPANDIFYVSGKDLENRSFKIYDVLGSEVLNGTLDDHSVTVSTLTQGVYIFKITDEKGNAFTKQFIKN